jgi:hypothetical protein
MADQLYERGDKTMKLKFLFILFLLVAQAAHASEERIVVQAEGISSVTISETNGDVVCEIVTARGTHHTVKKPASGGPITISSPDGGSASFTCKEVR